MYRRSQAGKRWLVRPQAPPEFLAIDGLPSLIRQILYHRGVRTSSEADLFLHRTPPPLPDLASLPEAEKALVRIGDAIRHNEAIAVYGDFDVDGITASAILTEALRELGASATAYIPDRFSEGYGLNVQALSELRSAGATLLISADCGTSSVGEVAHASEIGMDTIVIDHHTVPPGAAAPLALVNPKRLDSLYPFTELASVGVSYRLMEALYDFTGRKFVKERFLDLVALGTVADVVPLVDENRYLVKEGLVALAATERPGLQALMLAAGVTPERLDVESIGFMLAPRLNAAGRLTHASHSYRLIATEDADEADNLAAYLSDLNRERQRQTAEAVDLAQQLLEQEDDMSLIFVGDAQIPVGIVGLVAGRLAEQLCRPAIVYHRGEHESRGSARSIPNFDISKALRHHAELMVRFGGHHQAAGFTAANGQLMRLKEELQIYASELLAGMEPVPTLEIDAELPLKDLTGKEIRWLRHFQPCGAACPEPTFLSRNVLVADARPIGSDGRHLRLKLRDAPVVWPAIAFRRGDFEVSAGQTVDIVYSLAPDNREDGLELRLHDLRLAGE